MTIHENSTVPKKKIVSVLEAKIQAQYREVVAQPAQITTMAAVCVSMSP